MGEDFDASVLVAVNFFAGRAGDDRCLKTGDAGFLVETRGAVRLAERDALEFVGVAGGSGGLLLEDGGVGTEAAVDDAGDEVLVVELAASVALQGEPQPGGEAGDVASTAGYVAGAGEALLLNSGVSRAVARVDDVVVLVDLAGAAAEVGTGTAGGLGGVGAGPVEVALVDGGATQAAAPGEALDGFAGGGVGLGLEDLEGTGLEGGEVAVVVDEDEALLLAVVVEVVGDALLFHEAGGEREVGLAELDAIVAARVIVGVQGLELDVAVVAGERRREDEAQDVDGGAVLPGAGVNGLGEEGEGGADLEADVVAAGVSAKVVGGDDEAVDGAGVVAVTVEFEGAVVAKEVVEVDARLVDDELEGQVIGLVKFFD